MAKNLPDEEKLILSGNNEDINKSIQRLSSYYQIKLPNVNLIKINETNIESKDYFALKPTLPKTESREEIENKKQEEEIQKKQQELAYNSSYSYSRDVITRETRSYSSTESNTTNYINGYYYGYCTWYVANQKNIPQSWGNAGQWLYGAISSGYATGSTPEPGAIIVTGEGGYGHVGIVQSVHDNAITISEMNYIGWGIVNEREIGLDNPVIRGYIY